MNEKCFRQALSTHRKHHIRNCALEDNPQRQLHVDRLSAPNQVKLADYQRSLTANCMLNCSPGPRPGAPLKSPMVSVTCPNPLPGVKQLCATRFSVQERPTDPTPEANFVRLQSLNIYDRSCS